jgi:hypothetical protein
VFELVSHRKLLSIVATLQGLVEPVTVLLLLDPLHERVTFLVAAGLAAGGGVT